MFRLFTKNGASTQYHGEHRTMEEITTLVNNPVTPWMEGYEVYVIDMNTRVVYGIKGLYEDDYTGDEPIEFAPLAPQYQDSEFQLLLLMV